MDVLKNNSTENTKYLFNTVKTLKIAEYIDNNVDTFASFVFGVVSWLINLVYSNGKCALPEKFVNYLLGLFKTTSVTKFNALFAH